MDNKQRLEKLIEVADDIRNMIDYDMIDVSDEMRSDDARIDQELAGIREDVEKLHTIAWAISVNGASIIRSYLSKE